MQTSIPTSLMDPSLGACCRGFIAQRLHRRFAHQGKVGFTSERAQRRSHVMLNCPHDARAVASGRERPIVDACVTRVE